MRDLVDVDRLVGLTADLVSIDTANPPGHEAPITAAVRAALDPWSPAWTEVEPEPGRCSLVAALPHPDGPGERPTLIVNGHLDVVPAEPRQWTSHPFRPEVRDGRLYGRGSADMKGGIAAAICALDVVRAAGRVPAWDVVFHLVADEEVGGTYGTRALLDAGLITGDACLVPEPTGLGVCVAERGLLQGHITVHGVPGHGSRPHEGVSAVAHAAAVALALHGADFGGTEHPLLGRPSANIGTICGGSGLNVIAESCTLGVDRRVLPGATVEDTVAELRAAIDAAGIDGLRYDLEVDVFGEASELDPGHPWACAVGRAVRAVTGSEPATIGMTFTTDARFVRNQAGIPAVVCGPGEVAQAHTIDEFVAVDQLVDAAAVYATLLVEGPTPG
jgi:succinyl-diaminopimelate desuccinylase